MTITILKAVAVIVILALMILLLLSVNHFLRGDFDARQSDADRLREELDNKREVITDESIFNRLVKVRSGARPGQEDRTTPP